MEEELVTSWDINKVSEWIAGLGISADIAAAFTREGIDGKVLEMLTPADLKEMGVSRLGDRVRIIQEIRALSAAAAQVISVPFNYDESVPFATDAEYLEAVRSHFLLKKMKILATRNMVDHSDSDALVGPIQRKIAHLDEMITTTKRVIDNKLALAEQTPSKLLPRLIRSARYMKMSVNETWALAFMLVNNVCVNDFLLETSKPAYFNDSPSTLMHLLYTYVGMSMDEVITFMDDSREHFKEGLFDVDEFSFAIKFTRSSNVNKCLTGCDMSKSEILKLGGTVFGKVLSEEEGEITVTGMEDKKECAKKGEDEEEADKEEVEEGKDANKVCSDALSMSQLDKLIGSGNDDDDENLDYDSEILDGVNDLTSATDEISLELSFGGEERDPTEAINEPYSSNLEYLKDQFTIIENKILYKVYLNKSKKMDSFESNKVNPKLVMRECAAKVRATSACVSKRLAKTLETEGIEQPRLEELAKLHNLDAFEKSVLLLLVGLMISEDVRRAWSIENRSYIQKNFTLGSVFKYLCGSLQNVIESRKYFYCNSKLVRENMVQIDASSMASVSIIGSDLDECNIEIDRRLFDYIVGLDTEIGDLIEGSELFTPHVRLDEVVLAEDKKRDLLSAVENFDRWQAACAEVGLTDIVAYGHGACLLFHGPSGTGKTMTAHAIANHLGKKILQVAIPTLDPEKSRSTLQLIFREAKLSNAIIFFDECDNLFASRKDKISNIIVNILLSEIEKSNALIILATNLPECLDEAMYRRITLSLEFPVPDFAMRSKIWRNHIPPKLHVAKDIDWNSLAMDFEFSGGFIKNAVLSALAQAVNRNPTSPVVEHADLVAGARAQMRGNLISSNTPGGDIAQVLPVRSLADFVGSADIVASVASIAQCEKARRVLQGQWGFERGGLCTSTVATTVALFHGPRGSGRHTAAEAVAFEIGRPIYDISCGELIGQKLGRKEHINDLFMNSKKAGAVLVFSDCDSVFSNAGVNGMNKASLIVTMHAIARYKGVVIFIAENIETLAPSFLHFVEKCVEFRAPEESVRKALWERLIPAKTPVAGDIDYGALARAFPSFTGGNIAAAIVRASEKNALAVNGKEEMASGITTEKLMEAGKEVERADDRDRISRTGYASMYN